MAARARAASEKGGARMTIVIPTFIYRRVWIANSCNKGIVFTTLLLFLGAETTVAGLRGMIKGIKYFEAKWKAIKVHAGNWRRWNRR
jgi:hypothetical protein